MSATSPDGQDAPHPAEAALGDGLSRAALSVFVIDDRAANRAILAKLAGRLSENACVHAFDDAPAALEAATAAPPDLVITDFKMPGLNGAELVRAMRARGATVDVPIVVVTAYEDRQFRYEALQAGASDFLLSPVDRLEFVQRARNLLIMRRQQLELTRQAELRERRLAQQTLLRERALQLSEQKFQLVVNTLPGLVTVTEPDDRLSYVNEHHARFFATRAEDIQGARLAEALPAEVAARHAAANRKVLKTGETLRFEETLPDPDGAPQTFLTSKAALKDIDGRVANIVTVSVDISEQKRAETELAEAHAAAQSADRAKTEFLANISHELRTPLNAILGFADVMRKQLMGPLGSERYREYQEDIHASASQLLTLIDDLLDISRLDLGRMAVKPVATDLGETVEHHLATVRAAAAARGITLDATTAPGTPAIATDPLRVGQILSNLLTNAVKYGAEGGRIAVRLAPAPEDGITLTVSDDGPGMTEEELRTALSRFGRVGRSDTQNQPGAGLGLPIARDLARLLGGRLSVDTAPGRGTSVVVELPNLPDAEAAAPA